MAAHSAAGSGTAPIQSKHIQTNVIKTMMLVSAMFAITWAPMEVNYLILNIYSTQKLRERVYYATTFIGFLYMCTNPFIYATNVDPVRRVLRDLIPCKRTMPPPERIEMV